MASRTLLIAALLPALASPGLGAQRSPKLAQQGSPGMALQSASASPFQPHRVELAGVPTMGFPEFTFVQAFNAGDPVPVGIDTHHHRGLGGDTIDVYVVAHRTPDQWILDRSLVSATGAPVSFTPSMGALGENIVQVDSGTLPGFTGTAQVGIGYDVVLDLDQDGFLDAHDYIDGWGEEAGFTVMPNLTKPGPYGTTMTSYNGGPFKRQEIFYPTEITSLGELPLVMVSHGNGHNYKWYRHIGNFLSSWGYVVSSHENLTGPGIQTASESTLTNTDLFLNNRDIIGGGAMEGHVDSHTIIWIGHSRGAEGVAWAYNQLVNALPFPVSFTASDIKLVSSIAPTDFLGPSKSDPLNVPFQLWTGGADDDVYGCADNDIAQTFHLHDRADGERMSISLHGVGHGDFHSNASSSSVAKGPCLVGRTRTHRVMKGYLLPLLESVLHDNAAAREYLWRQYESFRPIAANSSPCIVADLMYRPDPREPGFVLDDFQANPLPKLSSSGGLVTWNVAGMVQGRLDDRNKTFTGDTGERFNGLTMATALDDSEGIVFEYGTFESNFIQFDLPDASPDLSEFSFLSFRSCQITRNILTRAQRGDLDFSVMLIDDLEQKSTIHIAAYGGGIEEPYLRRGCGQGAGWTSEWETIRIPLRDFSASGTPLDLSALRSVRFLFGSDHGSAEGRLGLDEIQFTSK